MRPYTKEEKIRIWLRNPCPTCGAAGYRCLCIEPEEEEPEEEVQK